jgi:hypothetical protein
MSRNKRRASRERRNLQPQRTRTLPGFVRSAQEECVSFFFTNFPHTANFAELRSIFCGFGSVGDFFIPAKKTKLGHNFGFVRFRSVIEVDVLLNKLQDIWLGGYKLKVNVSRFSRDSHKAIIHNDLCGSGRVKHGHDDAHVDGRSYLHALKCNERASEVVAQSILLPPPPTRRSIVGDVSNERLSFLTRSLVGYLKTEVKLLSLMDCLVLHGLHDISVCPLGGGLVLISSKIEGLTLSLFDHDKSWWGDWFSKIEPWSPGITACRREVWLSCWGVPIQCWGIDIFRKIANSFGVFVMMDESTIQETNFERGRIKVQ